MAIGAVVELSSNLDLEEEVDIVFSTIEIFLFIACLYVGYRIIINFSPFNIFISIPTPFLNPHFFHPCVVLRTAYPSPPLNHQPTNMIVVDLELSGFDSVKSGDSERFRVGHK